MLLVQTPREFGSMSESTSLTRTFSDQGVKLRVRKDNRAIQRYVLFRLKGYPTLMDSALAINAPTRTPHRPNLANPKIHIQLHQQLRPWNLVIPSSALLPASPLVLLPQWNQHQPLDPRSSPRSHEKLHRANSTAGRQSQPPSSRHEIAEVQAKLQLQQATSPRTNNTTPDRPNTSAASSGTTDLSPTMGAARLPH